MIPSGLKYTEQHEWVKIEGDIATIGITDHAVDELGDIVFVELPDVGASIQQMHEFGSIESVKTLSSLYAPVTGEVLEVNTKVIKDPSIINDSPYEEGWLIKVSIADEHEIDDLMSAEEYAGLVKDAESE